MKKNNKFYYIITIRSFLLLMFLFSNISCKNDQATDEVANKSYGLKISAISGDNQIGSPDRVLTEPFVIKVTDLSGLGVQDISVTFTDVSNSGVRIASQSIVSSSTGYGQTDIKTPAAFAKAAQVKACISNSTQCVTFTLNPKEEDQTVKYVLYTQNNDNEVAGVPFNLEVHLVTIDTNTLVSDYNGTINLEWQFITKNSWGNTAATVLPGNLDCVFVNGICNVSQQVTLTNSLEQTRVFVGDGPLGFGDVFSHRINVATNVPSDAVITDNLGGPVMGAVAFNSPIFTTDDVSQNFYVAITDTVGNYIMDGSGFTWSSPNNQIQNNLSQNSSSATLTFQQTLNFITGGGSLVATNSTYTASLSPLYIDPGLPANIIITPIDPNSSLPINDALTPIKGGEPFHLGITVVDSKGNLVGNQFSSNGVHGIHSVQFTFSNYLTGARASGGTTPAFHYPGSFSKPKDIDTNFYNFNLGEVDQTGQFITFYDTSSVSPKIDVLINFDGASPYSGSSVSGSRTFNVAVGAPDHINLRYGLGASALPACYYDEVTKPNSIIEHYYSSSLNIENSSKTVCQGLENTTDGAPTPLYAAIEDKGGNFIANLPVDWETQTTGLPTSLFNGLFSPNIGSPSTVFTPNIAANGNTNQRYVTVKGTYGSVPYVSQFLGRIDSGALYDISLKVMHWDTDSIQGSDQVNATLLNNLAVIPLDAKGNPLSGSEFSKDFNIYIDIFDKNGNPIANFSNGGLSGAIQLPTGLQNLTFSNVISGNTSNLSPEGLENLLNFRAPKAGEYAVVTVTDGSSKTDLTNGLFVADTLTITSMSGDLNSIHIFKDANFIGGGTDITNQVTPYTTDDEFNIYAEGFDIEDNHKPLISIDVNWDLVPGTSFTMHGGAEALASNNVFSPAHFLTPGVGKIRATHIPSAIEGTTGDLTISHGLPQRYLVTANILDIYAGDTVNTTITLVDIDGNIIDSPGSKGNGLIPLTFNINGFSAPRATYPSVVTPASQDYNFINGVAQGTFSWTVYASSNSLHGNTGPGSRLTVETHKTEAFFKDKDNLNYTVNGETGKVNSIAKPFHHLAAVPNSSSLTAGGEVAYVIQSEDMYNNRITLGEQSNRTFQFDITSSLGDEDITSTVNMNDRVPGDLTPLNQKTITGRLSGGSSSIYVKTTKAGTITVNVAVIPDGNPDPTDPKLDGFLEGGTLKTTEPDSNLHVNESLTVLPHPTYNSLVFDPVPSNSQTTGFLNAFSTKILDMYGNVITTNSMDTLTISYSGINSADMIGHPAGGQVTLSAGSHNFSYLRYPIAGAMTIIVTHNNSGDFVSKSINVDFGVVKNTVVKLPGQSLVPGQLDPVSAISGSANTQTVGTSYPVTVYATDDSYNISTTYTSNVSLISSDPHIEVVPASQNFVNGEATFTVTSRKKGTHNITAVTGLPNNYTSSNFTVNRLAASQYVAILPGQDLSEGAPDLATAINGTATSQLSGTAYDLKVYALDNYFNIDETFSLLNNVNVSFLTDSVANSLAPPAQNFSGGLSTISIKNYLASGTHQLQVSGTLTSTNSENYTVNGGPATQYLVKMEGQTFTQGFDAGTYDSSFATGPLTGSPKALTTDETIQVTVYAVDDYYNIDQSNTSVVSITTTDPTDTHPVSSSFSSGQKTFTVSPVTVGTHSVSVTAAGLSNHVAVAASTSVNDNYSPTVGARANIVVLHNDETLNEGQTSLSITGPGTRFYYSNEAVTLKIYSTDSEFNKRNDSGLSVGLSIPGLLNTNSDLASTVNLTGVETLKSFKTYLVGTGYKVRPSSVTGSPTYNDSTTYDIQNAVGNGGVKYLLVQLPNQSHNPGVVLANVISGTPFHQTVGDGTNYKFDLKILATDLYGNIITSESSAVDYGVSTGAIFDLLAAPLASGQKTFNTYFTSGGAGITINPTGTGFTLQNSTAFNVNASMTDPTIDLRDNVTNSPTIIGKKYIRQAAVNLNLTHPGNTVAYWCISETQSTRPASATNSKTNCNGGVGSAGNGYWVTSNTPPTSYNVLGTDGDKQVYVWVADSANNVSLNAVSDTITLDTQNPSEATLFTVKDTSSSSTTITDSNSILATATFSTGYQYCIKSQLESNLDTVITSSPPSIADACWSDISDFAPDIAYAFSGGVNEEKTVEFFIFTRDEAYNMGPSPLKTTIKYDSKDPAGVTITGVTGGTGDSVNNNILATTGVPTINWTASSESNLDKYDLRITGTSGGDCASEEFANPSATSYTFSGACVLTEANNPYTVYVKETDLVGKTKEVNFTFNVDLTGPGSFSITGLTGGDDTFQDDLLQYNLTSPTVNWDVAPTDVSYYKVSILNTDDSVHCAEQTQSTASATSFNFASGCTLANEASYKANVVAYDENHNPVSALNSPYLFTTNKVTDFLVELSSPGDKVSNTNFTLNVTARYADGSTVSNYSGNKSITFTTTGGNGASNWCSLNDATANVTPVLTNGTVNFTAGVATSGIMNLKKAENGVTITANDGTISGETAGFNVVPSTVDCVKIETASGGGQTSLSFQSVELDTIVTVYSASYDALGNYMASENEVWSGIDSIEFLPISTGVSKEINVTTTKWGSGTLKLESGSDATKTKTVGFNVYTSGNGELNLSSSSTDSGSNSNYHLQSNNTKSTFYWDVASDAVNSWRTNSALSWHSEVASSSRGDRSDFPHRAFLVAHDTGLDIIDSATNQLYMKFILGASNVLDSDLGTIQALSAINGKVVVGLSLGLIIIDFENDQVIQISSGGEKTSSSNISNRNSASDSPVGSTSYTVLPSYNVLSLDTKRLSGVDYLALGTSTDAIVMPLTGVINAFSDTSVTAAVNSIKIDAGGQIYYSESGVGVHRENTSISAIAADFSYDFTYSPSTAGQIPTTNINAIEVIDGTGQTSENTLLVATDRGLASIQENAVDTSATSKIYTINSNITSHSNANFGQSLGLTGSETVTVSDGLSTSGSLEFFFRPATDNPTNQMLYQSGNDSTEDSITVFINGSGQVQFGILDYEGGTEYRNSVTSLASSFLSNQWYFVSVTFDNATDRIELWVDSETGIASTSLDLATFSLGGAMTAEIGNGFNGNIDSLRINTTALSTGGTKTIPTSELVGGTIALNFNGTLGVGSSAQNIFYATPLFTGESDNITALSGYAYTGNASAALATSYGLYELEGLKNGGSVSVVKTDSSVSVKSLTHYHIDSASNNDLCIGTQTSGVKLKRR